MSEIIKASKAYFEKAFELPVIKEELNEEDLIQLILPTVKKMLDRDLERLLSICYRIDLGENKLKKILHESAPESMAYELSSALVKRQIQKIEIRQKYKHP
ncbi:hypothetical protein [Cecembia sp.]|uniref:hypothetical protein n=1 Tax=Cecembia sp. TaxID=1898110 RepID=UPI0025C2065B|nr:hypothetical protein [Cecembia sp.]